MHVYIHIYTLSIYYRLCNIKESTARSGSAQPWLEFVRRSRDSGDAPVYAYTHTHTHTHIHKRPEWVGASFRGSAVCMYVCIHTHTYTQWGGRWGMNVLEQIRPKCSMFWRRLWLFWSLSINTLNIYFPVVRIKSTQKRYQLLQPTHPSTRRLPLIELFALQQRDTLAVATKTQNCTDL